MTTYTATMAAAPVFEKLTAVFYDTDKEERTPHGFRWVYWESYVPSFSHTPYFCYLSISVVDDFGDLYPAYLPAVLNLKHEGH